MNVWTLTYAAGCSILALAIYWARGTSSSPAWLRLSAWWLASALSALLLWSTLACSALPLIGDIGLLATPVEWGACFVGSAIWASFVVAVALPFYGLLLTWYVLRFGHERGGWPVVARNAALLALPPAAVLLYGYGFPAYDGLTSSLFAALPYACLGFLAGATGLLAPRLLVPRLGPGRLVRTDAV